MFIIVCSLPFAHVLLELQERHFQKGTQCNHICKFQTGCRQLFFFTTQTLKTQNFLLFPQEKGHPKGLTTSFIPGFAYENFLFSFSLLCNPFLRTRNTCVYTRAFTRTDCELHGDEPRWLALKGNISSFLFLLDWRGCIRWNTHLL